MTAGLTGTAAPTLLAVRIEAIDGPGAGASAQLEAGLMIIGSDPGCDLQLADAAVSRRHASIELLNGAVRVRDLGSRNGTRYLSARISEAEVPLGGSVKLGKTTLRFTPLEQEGALSEKVLLGSLIGSSLPMRRLFARLERIAPREVTVLLLGESGVGKDAVARTIHALSPRADRPFVVFDCAAVSAGLVESELFGHEKGAFSGAARERAGVLEGASGGTLFLDEIGELPLELQPKLLRALESREFRRVGGSKTSPLDARVIAATHRDLPSDVKAGRFRADLLYRLDVVRLEIPPLRARREDIPLLAAAFARECSGREVKLGGTTLAMLQSAEWAGNVRELRNAVQRAVVLGELSAVSTSAPRSSADSRKDMKTAREALIDRFEHDYLSTLLHEHKGNISAMSREAGVSRMTLYRLIEKHGLGSGTAG